MNSENSKTSEPHVLVLKLTDKLDLRRGEKMLPYQTLVFITHGKTWKAYIIKANLKYQLKHGMINLNYQMGHYNPLIRICISKIENRTTFKNKTWYYLEVLTPETMKLLGSTKNKITKEKNSENVPHFEIAKVVLVHCNLFHNNYQQDSRVLYTFVPIKPFGNLLEISPKNYIF